MMSVQLIPRAARSSKTPPLQGDFGICIELFEILTWNTSIITLE